MAGTNLTREEAKTRAQLLAVDSYTVQLDLARGDKHFAAVTTVRFTARTGSETFIDIVAESVEKIGLNGVELSPAKHFADSRIFLPELAAHNELVIESTMNYTNTGEGLHRFKDPADGEVYLYSQFEVPDSRRMFAVFEQPDLKAAFTFDVTAPARWKVFSCQPTPTPIVLGERDGETLARWVFEATPRMSSYITALVAGPYHEVRGELTSSDGRTIPLGVQCRKSLAEHLDAQYVMEITRQGFAFYEKEFDYPYPFAKYDQIFVPEFNAGAMENVGCVTYTEAYVFRSNVPDAMRERRVITILHELAHMWFGDLVTMKWWDDLWLNESFAEYMSHLCAVEATTWRECWTAFAASEKNWAYRQDQLPSTHPIFADIKDLEDVMVNFDGITYAKGAAVLKQLVAWVGREHFMRGVHNYFMRHAYGNAVLQDLLRELEAVSGRELDGWSKKWLLTTGMNSFEADFEVDERGRFARFRVLQHGEPLRPHRIAVGFYSDVDGRLERVLRHEFDVTGASVSLPELVGHDVPELVLLGDDDLSYAKNVLDVRSLATVSNRLCDISDSLARALVWQTLWQGTRDGVFAASDFVALVLRHVAREDNSTTLRHLLGQLVTAVDVYVTPARQRQLLCEVADALWGFAVAAEAGSDRQFQFVRQVAAIAEGGVALAGVRALFAGELSLPGLVVDTDLRWDLVFCLASAGVLSAADVARELQGDRTASGERNAAQALASMPGADAKLTAWNSIFGESSASNLLVRQSAQGFLRAADKSVLASFVERFFAELLPVWNGRSFAIAEGIIEGFFPLRLASPGLRDAARAWLDANADAPHALLRLVREGLSDVERALACQERDGRGVHELSDSVLEDGSR